MKNLWRLKGILPLVLLVSGTSLAYGGDIPQSLPQDWWVNPETFVPMSRTDPATNEVAKRALARFEANSEKRYTGNPEEVARQFIDEYSDYFTGQPKEVADKFSYEVTEVRFLGPAFGTRVTFDQYFNGLKIYKAKCYVYVDSLNTVVKFRSKFIPPYLEMPGIQVNEKEIQAHIMSLLGNVYFGSFGTSELVIYPSKPPRFAFVCYATFARDSILRHVGWRQIVLDAFSKEILSVVVMFTSVIGNSQISTEGDTTPSIPEGIPRLKVIPMPPRDSNDYEMNSVTEGNDEVATQPVSGFRDEVAARLRREALDSKTRDSDFHSKLAGNAWFTDADYTSYTDVDEDGFDRTGLLSMVVETYLQDHWVFVDIWAVDSLAEIDEYVGTTAPIHDGPSPLISPDSLYLTILHMPHQDLWDFELYMYDTLGNLEDVFISTDDSDLGEVTMEHVAEDLRITSHEMTEGPDNDSDGFPAYDTLIFFPDIDYDTTLQVSFLVWVRHESGGGSTLFGETASTEISLDNDSLQGILVSSLDSSSNWNFRIQIRNTNDNNILSSTSHGSIEAWSNVQIERALEDPPINVVFMPNPICHDNDTTLWDDFDSRVAVIDPQSCGDSCLVMIPDVYEAIGSLQSLSSPDAYGNYRLQGSYVVNIDSLAPRDSIPVRYGEAVFPFSRDNEGFEALMCYYWIDWNQTYIQDLGFDSACNRPCSVDARAGNNHNAHYQRNLSVPGNGWLWFELGGTDAAEDADVILHEYGHAVQDNQNPDTYFGNGDEGYGNETRAMAEGFCDYWACSNTKELSDAYGFEPAFYAEWFQRTSPVSLPYQRRVNTNKHYPDSMVDAIHADGEIWSSCLWCMLSSEMMGKRATDSLILRSHELIESDSDPTFEDGAFAIIDADKFDFDSKYSQVIRHCFISKGILDCDCPHQGNVAPLSPVPSDSIVNVLDVVAIIDYVFRSGPSLAYDDNCPYDRADVAPLFSAGDGDIDVLDVVAFIDFVFRSGLNFGQPCNYF